MTTVYRQNYTAPDSALRAQFDEQRHYRTMRREYEFRHNAIFDYEEKDDQVLKSVKPATGLEDDPFLQGARDDMFAEIPRLNLSKSPKQQHIVYESNNVSLKTFADADVQTSDFRSLQNTIMDNGHISRAVQTPFFSLANDPYEAVPFPKRKLRESDSKTISDQSSSLQRAQTFASRADCYRLKCPFAPFGCGDKQETVAGKRTFNVKANSRYVYPSALYAAHRNHNIPFANYDKLTTSSVLRPNLSCNIWNARRCTCGCTLAK